MARTFPYKDFLQPALQRRFASTAGTLLIVSYGQALFLGGLKLKSWGSIIWSLLPFSTTGLRAACLFSCGFAVLILRIAHYHVGIRSASSPARSLRVHILTRQTLEAVFWYTVSSAMFFFVHVLTAHERAGLSMVAYTPARRAILNEKPIYFMCATILAGIWQALMHRFFDEDRLDLTRLLPAVDQAGLARRDAPGVLSAIVDAAAKAWLPEKVATRVAKGVDFLSAVLPNRLPDVLAAAFARSVVVVFGTFPAYFLVLRGPARGWFLRILRPFVSLPRSNAVPHGLPVDIMFMMRCAYAIFHLMFIWYVANQAFSSFMAQEPLKNGQPLTADSKDANGSLLNGLKSKKLRYQSFAMWELRCIADGPSSRRRGIFDDIDRKDGTVWSQIYQTCMAVIRGTELRVDELLRKKTAPAPEAEQQAKQQVPASRALVPVKSETVMPAQTPREILKDEIGNVISNFARSPGQTPASRYVPFVVKALETVEGWLIGEGRVAALWDQISALPILRAFLRPDLQNEFVPESWPLSPVYAAQYRFTSAVLGEPYADPTLHINAAYVLGQLAVHSLVEDQFGNVHRDVPELIRSLTAVITNMKTLRGEFISRGSSEMTTPEVDAVAAAMRAALKAVVDSFSPYRVDLRLSPLDLKLANEAIQEPVAKPALPAPSAPATGRAITPPTDGAAANTTAAAAAPVPAPAPAPRVRERASENVDRQRRSALTRPPRRPRQTEVRPERMPEMRQIR